MKRHDDNGRSKWASREGERWWLGAVTYGGGMLATALVVAVVIAIFVEELWIVLVVAGVVVMTEFALAAFINGDSWWD